MFLVDVKITIGTTNGRRLALIRGFCSPLCYKQGGNFMGILEVVAIIGLVLTAIKFGFTLGKNAKK